MEISCMKRGGSAKQLGTKAPMAESIQGSIPQASHLEASTPALPVPPKRDPWCGHRSTGVVDLKKKHKSRLDTTPQEKHQE